MKHAAQDAAALNWRTVPLPSGVVIQHQTYFDGWDEPPRASCARFPVHSGSPAHFHFGSEFQLLVEGTLELPDHTLIAPAVHYIDHCVPYGPFKAPEGNKMVILGPRQAQRAMIYMDQETTAVEARRLVNRSGRTMLSSAGDVEWEPLQHSSNGRRKSLISGGPMAEIVEGASGMNYVEETTPTFGRFLVVLEGSVIVGKDKLGPLGISYDEGGGQPEPVICGPEGAIFSVLQFDSDAEWDLPNG